MSLNTRTNVVKVGLADLASAQARWMTVPCKGARWMALSPGVTSVALDVEFQSGSAPHAAPTVSTGLELPSLPEPAGGYVLSPGGVLEFGGPVERVFIRPHTFQRTLRIGQALTRWSGQVGAAPLNMFAANVGALGGDGNLSILFGDCEPPQDMATAPLSGIQVPCLSEFTDFYGGLVTLGPAPYITLSTPAAWSMLGAWQRMRRVCINFWLGAARDDTDAAHALWLELFEASAGNALKALLGGKRREAAGPTALLSLNLGSPQEAMASALFGDGVALGTLQQLGPAPSNERPQILVWLSGDHGAPCRGRWERADAGIDVNPNVGALTIARSYGATPGVWSQAVPLNRRGRVNVSVLCEATDALNTVTAYIIPGAVLAAMIADGTPLVTPSYGPAAWTGVFAPGAPGTGILTASVDVAGDSAALVLVCDSGGGATDAVVRSAVVRAE